MASRFDRFELVVAAPGQDGEPCFIDNPPTPAHRVLPDDAHDSITYAMHQTDSVDYEIVLSGRVDIELPGGQVRTLRPGSLLAMADVPHAWKNHYDEDCFYMGVVVGATPAGSHAHDTGAKG